MKKVFLSGLLALFLAGTVYASPVEQYASIILDYSSQWSSGSWSAAQALGEPDTFGYGDIATAWAPEPKNGTHEYISLGFNTAIYSNGVTIRETYGNGFVYQIDLIDTSDLFHTIWAGFDTSQPGSPVNFAPSWSLTDYLVDGIKIYVDTNNNLDAWEEIDSVLLRGDNNLPPIPEPATFILLGSGLAGLAFYRRKRK